MRHWFWQIQAMGQGPDYVLAIQCAPSQAQSLVEVVEQNLPCDYVDVTDWMTTERPQDCSVYRLFYDRHTHRRMTEMHRTSTLENIYYFGEIEVRDHRLWITQVLTGGIMYDETELVVAVARSRELSLEYWQVAYSGYSWGEVAQGTSATSLLNYLQCPRS